MTKDEEAKAWEYFNPPGLLIGPLPHRKSFYPNTWVPDYRHPGVARRIAVEVDFIEDVICGNHRRNL